MKFLTEVFRLCGSPRAEKPVMLRGQATEEVRALNGNGGIDRTSSDRDGDTDSNCRSEKKKRRAAGPRGEEWKSSLTSINENNELVVGEKKTKTKIHVKKGRTRVRSRTSAEDLAASYENSRKNQFVSTGFPLFSASLFMI